MDIFGESTVGNGGGVDAGEDDDDAAGGAPKPQFCRKESRVIDPVLDPGRLRELTEEWHEQCAVCEVAGKIARGHWHWSECNRMLTID
jgi:hypothetical protein